MMADQLKKLLIEYQEATASFNKIKVENILSKLFLKNAKIHVCHPFGTLKGSETLFENCLLPLHQSMPDLERRDMIVMAGTTPEGKDWIGTMGNYMGTFLSPFLDIPPTGHLAHMRYHEYFQIENGKVTEMQAIWDIPELMMLAKAWPMAPQLGAYLCTPSPMSGDGISVTGDGSKNLELVIKMLTELCRYPENPDPRIMNLEHYWHPQVNWYGPAGIGTSRGLTGFRHWHQIPFLKGMPDRKLDEAGNLMSHWIAEGNYVCETGWPNMSLTLSGDGWMGIAPANKKVLLRSLDFWRIENGLIRENWVLVDLLDLYAQIGVNVLDRLKEFNKARNTGNINLSNGMEILK